MTNEKNWIVQKFGGTSVGKFPLNITNDIVKVYSKQNHIAVVCSARSTYLKTEGTTSRLLLAADLAIQNKDFKSILKLILNDHLKASFENIKNLKIQNDLNEKILKEYNQVLKILTATQIIEEVSSRSLDLVMSAGEKLSCLYMSAIMKDNGLNSKYLDLSNLIPIGYETKSGSIDSEFYEYLTLKLIEFLKKNLKGDEIPVITGYFGLVPGGLLNGVGRGYTDLSAALIAVALEAEELQIWKEVDGIFTADPRKVPRARLLPTVTPDEAAELTYYGSEVIHPFTMEQVINARIPIRIKNVMNPKGDGTVIYPDNLGKKGEATPPHPPSSLHTLSDNFIRSQEMKKTPTAVTIKHDIVVLNIHSNKKYLSHNFLANVFSILDKWKLVVDLISTSEVHVSMALHQSNDIEYKNNLKEAIDNLKKQCGTIDVTKNCAIVSLVGKQMRSLIGIAGQMFSTLAKNQINIEMISQGANEINISCVIKEGDALKALKAIHEDLLESKDSIPRALDLRLERLRVNESP